MTTSGRKQKKIGKEGIEERRGEHEQVDDNCFK